MQRSCREGGNRAHRRRLLLDAVNVLGADQPPAKEAVRLVVDLLADPAIHLRGCLDWRGHDRLFDDGQVNLARASEG